MSVSASEENIYSDVRYVLGSLVLTDSMLKPRNPPFSLSSLIGIMMSTHLLVWVFRKCVHSLNLSRLFVNTAMYYACYFLRDNMFNSAVANS